MTLVSRDPFARSELHKRQVTVYSASGMSRRISLVVATTDHEGKPAVTSIDWLAARLSGYRQHDMVAGAARRHPDSTILDARKIANNTLAYRVPESGTSFIALHDTDVLAWSDHGVVAVDTGGYNTVTTRACLNEFGGRLGVRVHTAKGVLHVNGVPCHRRAWVHPDGKVKTDMNEKNLDRLRSALDRFMAEWKRKGLPTDGAGDPWIISDSISEEIMLDWVRSRYVFRSFAAMAFRFSGVTEYGVAMWMADIDRRGGKLDRTQLGKIRRFARRHMGLA